MRKDVVFRVPGKFKSLCCESALNDWCLASLGRASTSGHIGANIRDLPYLWATVSDGCLKPGASAFL